MCKVRTAPINFLSIPKLELLGVWIGKRLAVFLRDAIDLGISETILWTDATTVLQWLNSTTVLPLFIHNRISEIRRTPGISIRHTSGKQNPADLATRGENPKGLSKNNLWWCGPTWLTCETICPSVPLNSEIFTSMSCEKSAVLCSGTFEYSLLTEGKENSFSSWEKRIRIFSLVLKIRNVCFSKIRGNNSNILDNVDLRIESERLLIRELQKKYYTREYKTLLKAKTEYIDLNLPVSQVLKIRSDLDLFIDDDDLLLRCGGRFHNATLDWNTIHPVLLPRNGPVARSYINYIHKTSHHIALSYLLSKLREKYLIPKCRTLIKSVLHRCVGCRRWTGESFHLPDMPPLPLERVAEASPFLNIGIDYMGPIKIRSGDSVQKVHVVIFACLVTRAIHLEIARDTSAAEFLITFMRFSGIRGTPKFVITDIMSNFVFIQPMISDKVNIVDHSILNFSALSGIRWKFISQYSSWQGGAYERLIGMVKSCPRKSYQHLLDYVDLLIALCNIADTINNRPLTYVSSDEFLSALAPNHFLRLRTCGYAVKRVQIRHFRTDFSGRRIREVWEHITGVIENFWIIFQKDYLTLLSEKHMLLHPLHRGFLAIRPTVGQVVLVW